MPLHVSYVFFANITYPGNQHLQVKAVIHNIFHSAFSIHNINRVEVCGVLLGELGSGREEPVEAMGDTIDPHSGYAGRQRVVPFTGRETVPYPLSGR